MTKLVGEGMVWVDSKGSENTYWVPSIFSSKFSKSWYVKTVDLSFKISYITLIFYNWVWFDSHLLNMRFFLVFYYLSFCINYTYCTNFNKQYIWCDVYVIDKICIYFRLKMCLWTTKCLTRGKLRRSLLQNFYLNQKTASFISGKPTLPKRIS